MNKRKWNKHKTMKLALRLRAPIRKFLIAEGHVFGKTCPSLKEVSTVLLKRFPDLESYCTDSKYSALIAFNEMYHESLAQFWFKNGEVPFDAAKRNKDSLEFYQSPRWLSLRYQAFEMYGARCQCCGATPRSSGRPLHVDHIKPRSKYPKLQWKLSNLQILCRDCNLGKRADFETDWRSLP